MHAIILVLIMVGSGITASILNKYIVTNLQISGKFFILFMQTLFLLLILSIFGAFFLNILSFKVIRLLDVSSWIFPTLSLFIMVYSGLEANARLSISLFTILKNLTIPVISAHDVLFKNFRITPLTLLSFFFILLSSFLGAYSSDRKRRDSVSILGISWMIVNCFSSAAYIIRFNNIIRDTGINGLAAAWMVNALAFPLTFVCYIAEGPSSIKAVTRKEIGILAASGAAVCAIAVANAQAAHVFTTTTVAVINALNKLPIAASGVILGLESTGQVLKWISVSLGVVSSILYAISRMDLEVK